MTIMKVSIFLSLFNGLSVAWKSREIGECTPKNIAPQLGNDEKLTPHLKLLKFGFLWRRSFEILFRAIYYIYFRKAKDIKSSWS